MVSEGSSDTRGAQAGSFFGDGFLVDNGMGFPSVADSPQCPEIRPSLDHRRLRKVVKPDSKGAFLATASAETTSWVFLWLA